MTRRRVGVLHKSREAAFQALKAGRRNLKITLPDRPFDFREETEAPNRLLGAELNGDGEAV